jgi:hypothetical protein
MLQKHVQGWGRQDEGGWREQGLTDRLTLPAARSFFVWEDLTKAYDWPAVLPKPAEASSSTSGDTVALLPRPSGSALDMLLSAVLPAEAAPVLQGGASRDDSFSGRVSGGKRSASKARGTRARAARPATRVSALFWPCHDGCLATMSHHVSVGWL